MDAMPYYLAYEERYKAAFAAGAERWGHSPDDDVLAKTLADWVSANDLAGKRIIEFACGEGAAGVILSELGVSYHGVDIAPTAVDKAREALKRYPNARVDLLDMTRETTGELYDAALDCMGLHMLVTDRDRAAYLRNACASLKKGAPMLFFRESFRESYRNGSGEPAYRGRVDSFEEWLRISGDDYQTPSLRKVKSGDGYAEVLIPLVPARAKDRDGYLSEMRSVGFEVERFEEMDPSNAISCSVSLYARKP